VNFSPFNDLPSMPVIVPNTAACQSLCAANSNCTAYVVRIRHLLLLLDHLLPSSRSSLRIRPGPISRLRPSELLLVEGQQCAAASFFYSLQLFFKQAF
jgi:hypothetical protein